MNTMHKVIFLNGPRRSGKDTAAKHIISEWPDTRHKKMAAPLKRSLAAFFGVSDRLWKLLEGGDSNALKLEPLSNFFGLSWVEALIWFSEDVMKPKFGADVFGRLLVRDMAVPTPTALTVISDCRFAVEAEPIIQQYGAANCHVFTLYRDGHTFKDDSGSYIHATDLPAGVTFWNIENQYEPSMYRRQILIRVNKILGKDRTYD